MKDKRESNRDLIHAAEHFEISKVNFLLGYNIMKKSIDGEAKKRRITDEPMKKINEKME